MLTMTKPAPFGALQVQPPDSLLSLIKLYKADPRPTKIDLGVGVYRNAEGDTPVFAAIKAAEAKLLAEQASKSYLGPEGDTASSKRSSPSSSARARPPPTSSACRRRAARARCAPPPN
jgi:aromatic-amino-acid transaminase